MNYCTRPTAEFNSSLDHFHYGRPSILNYCNHIHEITVLLPNHTFHEEIEYNLDGFSETTFLISFNWFLSHEHLPNDNASWTLYQTQHHSQTTVLNHITNFSQSGNFIKGHTRSVQIVKTIAG